MDDISPENRNRKLIKKVVIRLASIDDISSIEVIESSLREDRPRAKNEGFLLSLGEGFEQYQEFVNYGAFLVAEHNGQVVGFWFALPPDSARMVKLLESKDKFNLEPSGSDVFDQPNLAWLAKVGVSPSFMRRGIATELYKEGFRKFGNWNFLTTTVRHPVFNEPSFNLQKKFNFSLVGSLALGDRGAFKDVVCDVHFRASNEE